MSLIVPVSADTSSAPRTGMRSERPVIEIRAAVSRSRRMGASSRPATSQPTMPITTSAPRAMRMYVPNASSGASSASRSTALM
ncbi:MAG: hypothetical protein Q7U41_00935 [Microbacterium sp.]|nr:hypothetical protein [Microbacterium sp.]